MVGSGGPCAGAMLPWGLDAGSWGRTLWRLRESPKGHLPGQWAQGACALDQRDCDVQRLAAREGKVPVPAARAMGPCLDMSIPSGGSQRHLGTTSRGGEAQEACSWKSVTVVSGSRQLGRRSPSFCCQGLASLVGLSHAQQGLTRHPGTAFRGCGPRGACMLKPHDCGVCR